MTTLNYTRNKPGMNSRAVGLAGVVIFHALLIYGLVSGLAQSVVKVIQQKVEVAVISEPPPPPPPPPKVEKVVKQEPTPQPKAYVPPVVNPPPVNDAPQNAIAATTSDPTPPAPVKPAPPPEPAQVGPISAKANCSRLVPPEYPSKAQEDEIQGVVKVIFAIGPAGKFDSIQQINFERIPARYQSAFRNAVSRALQGYECKAGALMTQEFSFSLGDA